MNRVSRQIPVALTIAGSDSGGGAGIQADLKTFHAYGCFGTSAITAVTCQNTLGVQGVEGISPENVACQIRAVLGDFPVQAVKMGMLFSARIIREVRKIWEEGSAGSIPLVVDPVMVSTSGHRLLADDAISELSEFLQIATLITPNIPEAEVLLGREIRSGSDMEASIRELRDKTGVAVLLKGGHREESNWIIDYLLIDGDPILIKKPRQNTKNTHGTGCTLSAAITAGLARGENLEAAVIKARDYLERVMRNAPGFGKGKGPMNHMQDV